ncbi:MAG TPA: hypothetical protein VG603_15925, partial [Chitinophagales bacterium]|nr:hypothetical protein [Chitinophagales bacterium]
AIIEGATQAAAIAAQPIPAIPKFAKGVVKFKGAGTDTSDSNIVAISANESIITAAATRRHEQELLAMNAGKYEQFIMHKYLLPALQAAKPDTVLDDYYIRQEIKNSNKILNVIARNTGHSIIDGRA